MVPTSIPHAVQCHFRKNHDRCVLDGRVGTVSMGGRQLTNLRFAVDMYRLAGSEFRQLERALKDYGIEISGEKTKLMTNNNYGMT